MIWVLGMILDPKLWCFMGVRCWFLLLTAYLFQFHHFKKLCSIPPTDYPSLLPSTQFYNVIANAIKLLFYWELFLEGTDWIAIIDCRHSCAFSDHHYSSLIIKSRCNAEILLLYCFCLSSLSLSHIWLYQKIIWDRGK